MCLKLCVCTLRKFLSVGVVLRTVAWNGTPYRTVTMSIFFLSKNRPSKQVHTLKKVAFSLGLFLSSVEWVLDTRLCE